MFEDDCHHIVSKRGYEILNKTNMKKEIVYIEKYALILSDEEIKENQYCFSKLYEVVLFGKNYSKSLYTKIIAHLPLSDAPILEGVPLLPPLEHICKFCGVSTTQPDEECYKASKYKYTEEEVRRAITLGWDGNLSPNEIIQSLQQPSRPTHFECEMEKDYRYNDDGERIGLPVHPTNKIKTTTNSQGQIELVGKYLNL
jgi:hypothetical protein